MQREQKNERPDVTNNTRKTGLKTKKRHGSLHTSSDPLVLGLGVVEM
jgi:hypothetical protein